MAFSWITKHNSPNYTPASRVRATWGRPRTVEAIAIHWWGDPRNNPQFEGIVDYLCRSSSGVSAHIVATGTGRRAACLVDLSDASWATNSANPYTISIECDPRARDSDYDVVAEVIAQLRSIYGNIPLVPHSKYVATACPGVYSLSKLNSIASKKQVSKDDPWGAVKDKVVTPTKPTWRPMTVPRFMKAAKDLRVYDLITGKPVGSTIKKGTEIDFRTKTEWKNVLYLRSKSSTDAKRDWGIRFSELEEITKPPVEPPVEKPEEPSDGGFTESDRNVLLSIQKLLQELSQWLRGIFK